MKKVLLSMVVTFTMLNVIVVKADEAVTDKRPVLLLAEKDVVDKRPSVNSQNVAMPRFRGEVANTPGQATAERTVPTAKGKIVIRDHAINQSGIMDMVENVLADIGAYHVISKRSVERSLQEQELFTFLNGESTKETTLKVPAYVMKVEVLQYRTEDKEETYEYKKKHSHVRTDKTQTAHVEMSFKIIDLKTQEAKFSERIHKEKSGEQAMKERSGKVGDVKGVETYLAQALDEVMQEFREKLLNVHPIHILSCTDEGVLTLDATSSVVKVGDVLKVFSLGPAVVSKRTGKETRSETEVASIRVTAASEEGSTAEFVDILTADCDWHVVVRRDKKTRQ